MELTTLLLILTVVSVAVFDFTNGFHDAADMVATAIASKAMPTSHAIIVVSLFTFLGPIIAGLAVADTIGTFVEIKGVLALYAEALVIAALLAAVSYNLITWKFGLPSSSSNSLAGGLVGSGLFVVGESHIHWGFDALMHGELVGIAKVVAGLFLSPLFGFLIGFLIFRAILLIFRRFTIRIRPLFIVTQYLSVAWLGFSHGANDAQKGMAITGMILFASGVTHHYTIPLWAVLLSTSAITLGTLFGGWSIIKTLGFELYHIKLIHSIATQLSSAFVNSFATHIGAPTSTTQVVTGSLLGVGASEKPSHVNWIRASQIVLGWLVNLPVSIFLGALYACILIHLLEVLT